MLHNALDKRWGKEAEKDWLHRVGLQRLATGEQREDCGTETELDKIEKVEGVRQIDEAMIISK